MMSSGSAHHHPFSLSSSIQGFAPQQNPNPKPNPKKKRNLPGTPDPDAEVIALSPKTLMATNRFVCEICNKGFQRDQNLQLHRRGHNLPWKLRQRSNKEVVRKKVYICPEKTCVHHEASRALGDLTGIKKHFSRKHGEKKWKCDKCSKKYAVQSDWKAHTKTCGTREYKCDCGTLFSRKDSFITHRAFCDALAEESARLTSVPSANLGVENNNNVEVISQFGPSHSHSVSDVYNGMGMGVEQQQQGASLSMWLKQQGVGVGLNSGVYVSSSSGLADHMVVQMQMSQPTTNSNNGFGMGDAASNSTTHASASLSISNNSSASPMSATALLQKAAQMGSTTSTTNNSIFSATFGVITSSAATNLNHHNYNFASHAHTSSSNATTTTTSLEQLKLFSAASEHNLTRDFLGMGGGGAPPPPFLPQELAKFASIASPMGLTQFTTANH